METKNNFMLKIKIVIFFLLIITLNFCKTSIQKHNSINKNLSLTATNTWCEFELDNQDLNLEKCAWIGLITFKSKNAIKLKQINFKWSGDLLKTDNLSASLYQKKDNNDLLIPVEDNLVCDGVWDKKTQQLIFRPNEKLVAINKYYLVINFPENIESELKTGNFILKKNKSLKFLSMN